MRLRSTGLGAAVVEGNAALGHRLQHLPTVRGGGSAMEAGSERGSLGDNSPTFQAASRSRALSGSCCDSNSLVTTST